MPPQNILNIHFIIIILFLYSSIHVLDMGEGSLATHVVIGTQTPLQVLIECFEVEEYLQSIL